MNVNPITKKLIKLGNVIFWTVDECDISQEVTDGLYGAMANSPVSLLKYDTYI